ncbi:hypothetical protein [Seleniivibrio sp.]|uniref:hypothetical protein n=1 Tax=Seleniivibrio sp. TaxID=2898801 RepID=UPI0025E9652B|nr:hypothetical protein [Seleniivibrio sp.]MCD8553378.1 hypothetical protein [Seleniivibrio sp.]
MSSKFTQKLIFETDFYISPFSSENNIKIRLKHRLFEISINNNSIKINVNHFFSHKINLAELKSIISLIKLTYKSPEYKIRLILPDTKETIFSGVTNNKLNEISDRLQYNLNYLTKLEYIFTQSEYSNLEIDMGFCSKELENIDTIYSFLHNESFNIEFSFDGSIENLSSSSVKYITIVLSNKLQNLLFSFLLVCKCKISIKNNFDFNIKSNKKVFIGKYIIDTENVTPNDLYQYNLNNINDFIKLQKLIKNNNLILIPEQFRK